MINKNLVFWLGAATLIGFGGIGAFLIYWFIDASFSSLYTIKYSLQWQCFTGLAVGILSSLIALVIIRTKWVSASSEKYELMIAQLNLSLQGILFISFCAGVGEEIFFRGFVQHYLGIPITSIFFVAIHGYLNPKDIGISIYGLVMILVIMTFGYLYQEMGILAPSVAHFIFDAVLLASIRFNASKKSKFVTEIDSHEKD